MSKTDSLENEILKHIFQNENIALIGDATGLRGSTTTGVLYISLHTADPGEAGDQTTNEATYTSYARVSVNRDASNWSVSGNSVSNLNAITFPGCTGGTNTINYFGVGTAASGTGKLLYSGAVNTPLAVSNGVTPVFGVAGLSVTES
jgi:hypothetical protein